MTGMLGGTTIIELADATTEYGGALLASLGADVYLVEPPHGLATRERRPHAPGIEGSRRSIPFLARNGGKRSITLDPDVTAEMRALAVLLDRADGVLVGPRSPFARIAAEFGLNTPRVEITDELGLGSSGIVAFAAGGGLSSSGWPHQPPCNAPGWLALDGASIYAAVMLLLAMRTGRGPESRWEVPLREAANAATTPWTRPLHSYGLTAAGQGFGSARPGAGPYPVFACKDGFIRVLTGTPRQWEAWVTLLGQPEALLGDDWKSPQFRAQNYEVMVAIAAEIVADQEMLSLFARGQSLGLTITPVLDARGFLGDPHVRARGLLQTIEDPDLGPVEMLAPAYRLQDGSRAAVEPAPAVNADAGHRGNLLSRLPITRPDLALEPLRPLTGMRVLDCGVGAVVPEAASMLALLGAQVIKVESRKHVDFLRQNGLGGFGDFNNAPSFNQMNLGVQSIAVDATTEAGRALLKRLAGCCDVVMENMRGPVMKKWGLDYESVREVRPDVIYLSSQGLGDGPYGGYQTYGPNLQAFAGVTRLWAHPDDPYPVGSTLNHPDHIAGKQFLTAVLAAVLRRDLTGEGCYLDCAQFEAAASLIGFSVVQEQLEPGSSRAMGNASPDMAPHGCYPCAGEDRWCAIAVENETQWQALAALLGGGLADDPRFASTAGRLKNSAALDAIIAGWTTAQGARDVEASLRAAGVPAARVARGDDLAEDSTLNGGLFQCLPHPTAGPRWYTGLPVVHPHQGRIPLRRPPLLGEHDEEVLLGVLGLTSNQVSRLAVSGAVGF